MRRSERLLQEQVENLTAQVENLEAEADSQWSTRMMKRKLVVHLTTDQSIEGILVETFADGLLLTQAELLRSGAPSTPMGDVVVPREQIVFAQPE